MSPEDLGTRAEAALDGTNAADGSSATSGGSDSHGGAAPAAAEDVPADACHPADPFCSQGGVPVCVLCVGGGGAASVFERATPAGCSADARRPA
jgi:hypothetical protein